MLAQTKTKLKLVPCILHVFELSEFVHPSEVVLGTTELVRRSTVIGICLRAIRPAKAPIRRRPRIFIQSRITIKETGVTLDHDVSGVGCGFSYESDTTSGILVS
jgi:hypothetical protein